MCPFYGTLRVRKAMREAKRWDYAEIDVVDTDILHDPREMRVLKREHYCHHAVL